MCNYFVCFARSEGATLCQYLYEDYILKYVFIYGKDRERKADRVDSERTMDIKGAKFPNLWKRTLERPVRCLDQIGWSPQISKRQIL